MSPGRDVDPALAPPVARVGDDRSDPYGWIAEPTAELVDLLDTERAYYEARVAALAGLRARLAAEMAARVPDTSESRTVAVRAVHLPRGPRGGAPNSPPWCAEPATAVRTNRCSTCRWLPPPTPVPSFTAANSRSVPTDECWPGRTTSSATSGTAFGSATCRPVRTCPVSSRGPSREAGGARTRRRICICAPTLSIDRTRCGRTRWAPIPRPTYCSSRSPTSGSRSASTSPARGHGS